VSDDSQGSEEEEESAVASKIRPTRKPMRLASQRTSQDV
jgi:hypothetical protein